MAVRVLTDSTACLPAAAALAAGVHVLPLHVLVGRRSLAEGVEIDAAEVAKLLRRGKEAVSTSRPAPGELVQAYRALFAETGCAAIVSIHLSAKVSGTVEAAQLAAAEVREDVRVEVVDTRVLGMAMGYAALSAAAVAAAGGSVEEVGDVARRRASMSSTFFYVDTLEHLRRGGRVGAAAAILGSALAIKPLLTLQDGEVSLLERVRTRGKALARLEARCIEAINAAEGSVDVAVHHLDALDQATKLRERLSAAAPAQSSVDLVELGAVTGVHTGPGTLAVSVCPRLTRD